VGLNEGTPSFFTIGRSDDIMPVGLQERLQHFARVKIVFHNEDSHTGETKSL
jgi:hypothetical protein